MKKKDSLKKLRKDVGDARLDSIKEDVNISNRFGLHVFWIWIFIVIFIILSVIIIFNVVNLGKNVYKQSPVVDVPKVDVVNSLLKDGWTLSCVKSEVVDFSYETKGLDCNKCSTLIGCHELFGNDTDNSLCYDSKSCLNYCNDNYVVSWNETFCRRAILTYDGNNYDLNIMGEKKIVKKSSPLEDNITFFCQNNSEVFLNNCLNETNVSACKDLSKGMNDFCKEFYLKYPYIFQMEQEVNVTININGVDEKIDCEHIPMTKDGIENGIKNCIGSNYSAKFINGTLEVYKINYTKGPDGSLIWT